MLFQDFMTYDLSAAENIGVGDLTRLGDPAALTSVARKAGIHETLRDLPLGYDTMLSRLFADGDGGETGMTLSGGQWQRVAVARALMREHADLLILDEPSSGLDAEAEEAIHERLRALRAGRTSLLISHRLGAVRDADLIAVLDGGRIAELGGHAELLRMGGTYARLFTLQAKGYRDDANDCSTADAGLSRTR